MLLHADHCSEWCCSAAVILQCHLMFLSTVTTSVTRLLFNYNSQNHQFLCIFVSSSKVWMKDCSLFENLISKPQTNGSISITLSLVSICFEFKQYKSCIKPIVHCFTTSHTLPCFHWQKLMTFIIDFTGQSLLLMIRN